MAGMNAMGIGEIVGALVARGVREFVACPGAHDAAIIDVLVRLEERGAVRLWRHFEERGAGFFGLGRTFNGGPCAVVTTSGTAAAELLPAAIEAHYQARPLVLVTADRPRRFRGSGAPQAIEQAGLFGPYVEGADEVDGGETRADPPAVDGRQLLAGWSGRRPWHLNVCLEEDPGEVAPHAPDSGPWTPVRQRLDVSGLGRFLRGGIERGLVAMVGDLEPAERDEAAEFLRALGAPVVAEATSGLRERLRALALPDADRTLRIRPPGRVLRLGGVPSGRCWRDLERRPEVAVCSVTRSGFAGLARESLVVPGPVGEVLRALGPVDPWGDVLDHLRGAGRAWARLDELLEAFPASEPALVRTLSAYASLGGALFLGNSLPIREWNQFAQWQRPVTEVRANRGANGIDGQLSTWLGWTATIADAWALVGDLTALYDLAAPALLPQAEPAGRVLAVINNAGGRIFDRLPRLHRLHPRTRDVLTATQQARLGDWAAMWGLAHLRVAEPAGFDLLDGAARPLLLELAPDAAQTAAFWEAWDAAAGGG